MKKARGASLCTFPSSCPQHATAAQQLIMHHNAMTVQDPSLLICTLPGKWVLFTLLRTTAKAVMLLHCLVSFLS